MASGVYYFSTDQELINWWYFLINMNIQPNLYGF